MISFDLKVNAHPVTRVSAIRQGPAGDGVFVYEWNAWRVDPDDPRGIRRYAAGQLLHTYADGLEALAAKILAEYLSIDFGEPIPVPAL